MPRMVEEILQHAEELAARFEGYEPDSADELDRDVVAGALVGTTGEAARQRYSDKVA